MEGLRRKMSEDEKIGKKENVRFFSEGDEQYAAIIVPRNICEYFIHYKNEMEKAIDVKFESLGQYLFETHESVLEPDKEVEEKVDEKVEKKVKKVEKKVEGYQ